MDDEPMKVRALRRISILTDASQALEAQEARIAKWVELYHPDAAIEWYEDPGVSGRRPLRERPDGARLWGDLRRGDVLAVTRIDRLARSTKDLLEIVEHLEDVGATLVAVDQQIDTSGAFGRFLLTLLGALAELEASVTGERVRAARAQMIHDGRHPAGGVPYGWQVVPNPGGKGLVVQKHPDQAPRLREAALAVIHNTTTMADLTRKLGFEHRTYLRKLFTNPRIYGKVPGGSFDHQTAIISFAEWQQLQTALDRPKAWAKTEGYGEILRCWKCERRLYLDTNANAYRCSDAPNRHPGRIGVTRPKADKFVEDFFLEYYGQAPMFEAAFDETDRERDDRLAEISLELDEARAMIGSDESDDQTLFQTIQELKLERQQVEAAEPDDEKITFRDIGLNVAEYWQHPDTDASEKLKMVKQVLRVVVHPGSRKDGRFEPIQLGLGDPAHIVGMPTP